MLPSSTRFSREREIHCSQSWVGASAEPPRELLLRINRGCSIRLSGPDGCRRKRRKSEGDMLGPPSLRRREVDEGERTRKVGVDRSHPSVLLPSSLHPQHTSSRSGKERQGAGLQAANQRTQVPWTICCSAPSSPSSVALVAWRGQPSVSSGQPAPSNSASDGPRMSAVLHAGSTSYPTTLELGQHQSCEGWPLN
jgi:hypothetical protein